MTEGQVASPDETGHHPAEEQTRTEEHDLNLDGETGTDRLQPGESQTANFGVIDAEAQAWYTVPRHKEAGMELTIAVASARRTAVAPGPGPQAAVGSVTGMTVSSNLLAVLVDGQVVRLCMEGRPTKRMANALLVSPYTIQDHLTSLFDIGIGVRTRDELVGQIFLSIPGWEDLVAPLGWRAKPGWEQCASSLAYRMVEHGTKRKPKDAAQRAERGGSPCPPRVPP